MTNSTHLTNDRALTHIAHLRRRELRSLSRKLQAAEIKVAQLRGELDMRLYQWHEDGTSITDLSTAAGISRETVYRSINRYKAELASVAPSKDR
jgi:hypothetical protein